MLSSPSKILFSAFVVTTSTLQLFVAPSPLHPRQLQEGPNCILNARGKGVSIQLNDSVTHPGLELGVPFVDLGVTLRAVSTVHGFEEPDFWLQQNGQVVPSYVIKDVSNSNLALTFLGESNGDRLTLEQASNSGNDISQQWDFSCGFCDPNAAIRSSSGSGAVTGGACTMHPHNPLYADQCVQVMFHSHSPPYPVVGDCDAGNGLQYFNVVL